MDNNKGNGTAMDMGARQYWIWLRLLGKRLWKQPAYIGLLLLIPLLGCAVGMMEQMGTKGAAVVVYVEKGPWSSQVVDGLQECAEGSVLYFDFCTDELEVERRVAKSDADCGFIIPADLDERVLHGDWRRSVTVYETSGSSITGMAKERIGSVIFKLYSEQCYEVYIKEMADKLSEAGMDTQIKSELDVNTEEFSEKVTEFAKEAYERHLVDGSTFSFQYVNDDQYSQNISDTNVGNDTAVFPIKGVFAVIIFISGMCGMLEYDRDKQEKRFLRLAPNILTYMVDVWIPTVFVSAAVLVCLWISDGIRSCGGTFFAGGMASVWNAGMWCRQIGHLILYQCVIVLYCGILGLILRRQETISAAIPILSLGSLVCAPVFVRLAVYLPVFAVLEKLFPVTYYLLM